MSGKAIRESLGFLAVVVGIVFVGLELRQNRDLMRAQIRHELSTVIVEMQMATAQNLQFASVMRRGHAGEELSPDELAQFEFKSNAIFRYWENVHYQYREGLYDDVEFLSHRDAWAGYVGRSQAAVSFWCSYRGTYSPEFREALDEILSTFRC